MCPKWFKWAICVADARKDGFIEVIMRIKLILLSTLLASCSYLSTPILSPYKMDIRQGNYVTAEMREKLKLGMSKQQVRYVLGTPMISDAFHGNRWDYIYRLAQHGELVEKQRLTLYFEGDNLVRMDDGQAGQ
jgi:outer membrane protein assembly factor BamE